jgi:hypothetical protein
MPFHSVTHIAGRAHGTFDTSTRELVLSPGSILTIDPRRQPPANIRQNYRDVRTHIAAGNIIPAPGKTWQVVHPITCHSPSAARVFADGKAGSGWKAWRLPNGDLIDSLRSTATPSPAPAKSPAPSVTRAALAPTPSSSPCSGGAGIKEPPALPPPGHPSGHPLTPFDFAAALVRWIQVDPYHPPMGRLPVAGWDERIKTYAYANRANPVAWPRVYTDVAPFIHGLRAIIARYTWPGITAPGMITAADPVDLERIAAQICLWGGVSQGRGYADAWTVIKSAVLNAQHHGAPMNSGWTKVASFATDGLPNSQTIWDSRVSTSIIWRLDRILHASGLTPAALLPHYPIGLVAGRAYYPGSPRYRTYHFRWPNGYGRWQCHFAGSQLVRDMVKVLNAPSMGYPRMPNPAPAGPPLDWDVFGVGLVLFMDGR